jgi:hypothetical protein
MALNAFKNLFARYLGLAAIQRKPDGGLTEIFPGFAAHSIAYHRLIDTEFCSEGNLCFASGKPATALDHYFRG